MKIKMTFASKPPIKIECANVTFTFLLPETNRNLCNFAIRFIICTINLLSLIKKKLSKIFLRF